MLVLPEKLCQAAEGVLGNVSKKHVHDHGNPQPVYEIPQ
jgi:hypothetical protein